MLLGYLTSRFVTQRENLAAEALAFILNHADRMRKAFRGLVGRTGIALPELVRFRPQRREAQGIPDLVASDAKGADPLLVENKFSADLTESQPVLYLDRLPTEGGGALVFAVPRQRLILRAMAASVTGFRPAHSWFVDLTGIVRSRRN